MNLKTLTPTQLKDAWNRLTDPERKSPSRSAVAAVIYKQLLKTSKPHHSQTTHKIIYLS